MSVITVSGVTHRYGRSTALSDVSFSVEAGEVVALAGPSGSGKSTLVHLVAGFDTAQEGDVHVLERRPMSHRPVEALSLGEQQRVAVARALAGEPRALVLDEPTAHQDEGHLTVMVDALRSAAAAGTAVVVATHDPTLLAAAARTVRLADGRVVGREGRTGE
jgi:ABC-type lipoprotein export system ATPase subunit